MTRILKYIYSLICALFTGVLYGWSVFVAPLESEFGWQRDDTSLTFSISIIFMCFGILLGGQFNKKKDKPFISFCISAVLLSIGFVAISKSETLFNFYLFYGVICGFGNGFNYTELFSIPGRWFPKKRGLTQGMMMMCIGVGAMVLGTVATALMNIYGWREIFVGLSIVFPIVYILEGLILKSELCKATEQEVNQGAETTKIIIPDSDDGSLTTKEMIISSDFKWFYIWMVLLCSAGLALTGHIAPCALSMGASVTMSALLTGVVSVSNGAGRILYGFLYDILGVKRTMRIGTSVFLAATIVAFISVLTNSVSLLVLGCVFIGISFGLGPISGNMVVNLFYGSKYFSSNFGIMGTPLFFGAVIGPFISGKLYTCTQSYVSTFAMMVGFGILASVVANIVLKCAKKNNRKV